MLVWGSMHKCLCTSKPENDLRCPPCLLRLASHWPGTQIRLDMLASELQESSCLHSPVLGQKRGLDPLVWSPL